jgi:hypothetical protein
MATDSVARSTRSRPNGDRSLAIGTTSAGFASADAAILYLVATRNFSGIPPKAMASPLGKSDMAGSTGGVSAPSHGRTRGSALRRSHLCGGDVGRGKESDAVLPIDLRVFNRRMAISWGRIALRQRSRLHPQSQLFCYRDQCRFSRSDGRKIYR